MMHMRERERGRERETERLRPQDPILIWAISQSHEYGKSISPLVRLRPTQEKMRVSAQGKIEIRSTCHVIMQPAMDSGLEL